MMVQLYLEYLMSSRTALYYPTSAGVTWTLDLTRPNKLRPQLVQIMAPIQAMQQLMTLSRSVLPQVKINECWRLCVYWRYFWIKLYNANGSDDANLVFQQHSYYSCRASSNILKSYILMQIIIEGLLF